MAQRKVSFLRPKGQILFSRAVASLGSAGVLASITTRRAIGALVHARAVASIELAKFIDVIFNSNTETPSASDTGSVRVQNYCADDFFGESYVGRSSEF